MANAGVADVVVVGAGHNGLICAAYLARAGIDTILLEARDEVGGCASTVSDLGARFNICNCDHTLVRAMPIIDDLDLEHHGLRYIDTVPSGINVFYDGAEPWTFVHDQEQMLDALAVSHPDQVENYRRYLNDALPVAQLVVEMARTVPGAARMAVRASRSGMAALPRLLNWSRRSVADVFAEYFDDWHMAMPAISTGPTVWGVPPDTPGTGLAALAYATRHLVQTGRPAGGSGALTESTASSFESAGGRIVTSARVDRVLVSDGHTTGVRLTDGRTFSAPVVVAACDPQRVYVDWLDEIPPAAKRAVEQWRSQPTHDGYESKIDAVLSAAPRYRWSDRLEDRFDAIDLLGPTTIISPSPEQLATAHRLRGEGRVADEPTILVNVPSSLDPAMKTPEGHDVLSLEVLFTPYGLQGGWAASDEPQRWLDLWADFAGPDAADSVVSWRAMTPDRYESEFLMHRGHTPSYAGSPVAALMGRKRELTRYRTPISGLYLSGAATFPGAGIFGAPGRNAAAAVTKDMQGPIAKHVATARRRATAMVGSRMRQSEASP